MKDKYAMIPIERIERAILLIRGKKVMLDADLGRSLWCPQRPQSGGQEKPQSFS